VFAVGCRLPDSLIGPDNGWSLFDPVAEYKRIGVLPNDPSCKWRMTDLNVNYSLCDSYPNVLVVPREISDKDLLVSSFLWTFPGNFFNTNHISGGSQLSK
jgi:hypothetical protein